MWRLRNEEQDMQSTYIYKNEARSRNHYCRGIARSITCSESL